METGEGSAKQNENATCSLQKKQATLTDQRRQTDLSSLTSVPRTGRARITAPRYGRCDDEGLHQDLRARCPKAAANSAQA